MFLGVSLLLFSCKSTGAKGPIANFFPGTNTEAVSIGSAAMQFNKFFSSGIEKKDVETYFDPHTDMVYLQFRYQTVVYRQFWDKSNRLQFITALEKYKKDYEAKKLNLKGSRAIRAYGILKGLTVWGQFSSNIFMNAASRPRLELGYQFKQNSPYFTVHQLAADNIYNASDEGKSSIAITTYFTRAQADELAKLFDQQYLLSFSGPKSAPADTAPAQDEGYTEK
ncbi:hypothetical protein AGMMS49587_19910 [Spirochaetia bacterium]|nr:hypothetical protein AGMMS49587_19910 [Spirochaetia bacterium]